jgi:NAD+ synthase
MAVAIKEFIRHHVGGAGADGVVVGLSGGLDSSVVARLCVDALGREKVLGVALPDENTPEEGREEVADYADALGIELLTRPIEPVVEAFVHLLGREIERVQRGNVTARCRMIVLFHEAKERNRVVMGTGNKSELLCGYFTKFGDGGADFLPIGDLYKTQVRKLGEHLGIPRDILDKTPSAGLWEGQTDEEELGVDYETLDRILLGIELGMRREEISERAEADIALVDRVEAMVRESVHKRKPPLIPKIGVRTLGLDWRE